MASIKFFIQGQRNPSPIYVRLRDGRGVDAKAKTKYSINPNDWSKAKGWAKSKDETLKNLNGNLEKIRGNVMKNHNDRDDDEIINSGWLKYILNPSPSSLAPNGLVLYFDYYAKQYASSLRNSSIKKLTVNKHLLERFQQTSGKEYLIKDVHNDFKQSIENYCYVQEGYAQNTVARLLRSIKTMCLDAQSNGIAIHPQLIKFSAKNEKVEKIYLTIDELNRIYGTPLDSDVLDNVRDWLIISCETGQRISDFLNFRKEQIRVYKKKTKNGSMAIPLLEFTQVKSGKVAALPILGLAKEILNKRGGNFPKKISDQKYNEHVKTVCRLAGLTHEIKGSIKNPLSKRKEAGVFPKWRLVSSHIGRRSFATNYFGKINTSLLMSATGHTTERQFLEYVGKKDVQKSLQLTDAMIDLRGL